MAILLDQATYLGSVSTFYRVLRRGRGPRAPPPGHPHGTGEARAASRPPESRLELGYHQAPRPGEMDVLPPVRDPGYLQPPRCRLDAGDPRVGGAGREADR